MDSHQRIACWLSGAVLVVLGACGNEIRVSDNSNATIDPPRQCSPDRPDCSVSFDFPVQEDLDATNSGGVRYSAEAGSLVIDRVGSLADTDGDGVPDDADDCPASPGWRAPCDGDPTNDGIFHTLFYDPSGASEASRTSVFTETARVPSVDVYFLLDGSTSMAGEIGVLQSEVGNVVSDVALLFDDPQLGLGFFREYPLDPIAPPFSQAPYHNVLDMTGDLAEFERAVSSLNTVRNISRPESGTQALYSVASGQGIANFVPNRRGCPPDRLGFPCFRSDALRVVLLITDAELYNGPRPNGPEYTFATIPGVTSLPPVEMFPALFDADDAASALDLGDLSGRSLTLMGMSTLLNNRVNTAVAAGCQTQSGMPPGDDMDDKDVVVTFRFDSPGVTLVDAFADNTHWPGANVALFDDAMLDPTMALACDGVATASWGAIQWAPTTSQRYYLVADGRVPAADPGSEPEGAFNLSIVHDGDPGDPSWLTANAPIEWTSVEAALLASEIRVASVVSPRTRGTTRSDGEADARAIARATGAVTAVTGEEWVGGITASDGEGLGAAITNTLRLVFDDSLSDVRVAAIEDASTPGFDETEFIVSLGPQDCATGEPLTCSGSDASSCLGCRSGAELTFELLLSNSTVTPTGESQVFELEIVINADGLGETQRIPVRILVPRDTDHAFSAAGPNFYRNTYDSVGRCLVPPERPDWGDLTWTGNTPGDSSIEFQLRTANTAEELDTVDPVVFFVLADTAETTFDVGWTLIDGGVPNGLPFLRVTALLRTSTDRSITPELSGWQLEFSCFPAE